MPQPKTIMYIPTTSIDVPGVQRQLIDASSDPLAILEHAEDDPEFAAELEEQLHHSSTHRA